MNTKDEEESPAEEWTTKNSEIGLCKASVGSDGHSNSSSEASGGSNNLSFVDRANISNQVGPAESENSQ